MAAATAALGLPALASAQSTGNRLVGLDVSAWQGNMSQTTWNNIRNVENRQFVFIRSSRGGTTGEDHRQGGYPSGDNTFFNLSQRYDDPYFIQNVNRATAAGMFVGSYHFSRPDVIASTTNSGGIANTGTDEANHFLQMAGPFMRPGYLPPTHDLEAGDGLRTDEEMAQFTLDFSNRIYQVMGIRPAIYINGNYAANILGGASASLRNQIAQPNPNAPTSASPAYSQLWSARWPNQTDPDSIPIQTGHPKDSYSPIYGPWDDYGVEHPWAFWQYTSRGRLQSFNNGNSNLDFNVAQGGLEFVKDQLIPALWMNDLSGDWGTLANWNSGQAPIPPPLMPGQLTPLAVGPLPTPRLPGAAGTGPTAGSNDTVILDRPNANITVTLSSGSHNIRKLYLRETLNITGGSLNINYVPVPESTPMSARISGPLSVSGGASFSAHTVLVDTGSNFTAGNASLALDTLTLTRGASAAKLVLNGDVNLTPLGGVTTRINTTFGAGSSGSLDLAGGTRNVSVADGAAAVDLDVLVPITNGSLTKSGLGTMRLNVANTHGVTTISDGVLEVSAANQLGSSVVTQMTATPSPGHGGTLRLIGSATFHQPLSVGGGGLNGTGQNPPGSTGALDNLSGLNTWSGTITLNGTGNNIVDPLLNQVGVTGGTLVLSGVIQGGAGNSWAKTGDGDIVLTGASPNTHTHLTRIFGGRMILEKDGALGAAGANDGAAGNTFQLADSASTIAFRAPASSPGGFNYATFEVINTDGTGAPGGLGQVDNLAGDNTFAGQIALGGPVNPDSMIDSSIGVAAGSLHVQGGLFARASASTPRNISKLGAGTLILSGDGSVVQPNPNVVPLTDSTFNVNAGVVELRSPSATISNLPGVTTWNVAGGARLHLASGALATGSLVVATDGDLTVAPGGGKIIRSEQVFVQGTGRIDLADNAMILDYTGPSTLGTAAGGIYGGVTGLIQLAHGGGEWNGAGGIATSTADAEQGLTSLGIGEATEVLGLSAGATDIWRGQMVDASSLLIMYTYLGDANLDGFISGDDYSAIDFASGIAGAGGWHNGDFNYDGMISGDDYSAIDFNLVAQGGPLGPSATAGIVVVPEPASVAGMLLLAAGMVGARRRRGA